MDLLPYLTAIVTFLAFFLLQRKWKQSTQTPNCNPNSPPEAAGAWPLIGHLLQLRPKIPIARNLGAMADKYGPIFTIRLGMTQTLVVSNWELVKQCFTTNDKAFSSRPESSFSEYLCFDYAAFSLAPYGPYWLEMRKMVLQDLLSTRRLEKLRHIRISEVENTIKEMSTVFSNANGINGGKSSSPVKVEMSKLFEHLSLNIIVRKISGKRYTDTAVGTSRDAHFKEVVEEFISYAGQFVVSDVIPFPFLKWLDLGGAYQVHEVLRESS